MGVYSKAKIKLRGATENYMAVQLVGAHYIGGIPQRQGC